VGVLVYQAAGSKPAQRGLGHLGTSHPSGFPSDTGVSGQHRGPVFHLIRGHHSSSGTTPAGQVQAVEEAGHLPLVRIVIGVDDIWL